MSESAPWLADEWWVDASLRQALRRALDLENVLKYIWLTLLVVSAGILAIAVAVHDTTNIVTALLLASAGGWNVAARRLRSSWGEGPPPRLVRGGTYFAAGSYGRRQVVLAVAITAWTCALVPLELVTSAPSSSVSIVVYVAAALLFVVLVALVLRQRRLAGMTLRPEGVQRGLVGEVVPWDAVRAVRLPDPTGSRRRALGLPVRLPGAKGEVVIPTLSLHITLWQVLAVLAFYAEHPEARAELGTDAAVARITELSDWPHLPSHSLGLDWFHTPQVTNDAAFG